MFYYIMIKRIENRKGTYYRNMKMVEVKKGSLKDMVSN